MTRDATKEETETVLAWLRERGGERLAGEWFWNCTPMPCGPPSLEQLEEGLLVATGELNIGTLIRRIEDEMDRLMREYRETERSGEEKP